MGRGTSPLTQENRTPPKRLRKRTSASVMLLHQHKQSSRMGSQSGADGVPEDASAIFEIVLRRMVPARIAALDEIAAQDISEDEAGSFLYLEKFWKNNYIQGKFSGRQSTGPGINIPSAISFRSSQPQRKRKWQMYDTVIGLIIDSKRPVKSQADILTLCREQHRIVFGLSKHLTNPVEDGLIEAEKRRKPVFTFTNSQLV